MIIFEGIFLIILAGVVGWFANFKRYKKAEIVSIPAVEVIAHLHDKGGNKEFEIHSHTWGKRPEVIKYNGKQYNYVRDLEGVSHYELL